jgi:hypothetical protein
MFEREAAGRDGIVFRSKRGTMIAAVVVGKWESREVGGISKFGGKAVCAFPASVFSTTFFAASWLECAGHDGGPLLRSDS